LLYWSIVEYHFTLNTASIEDIDAPSQPRATTIDGYLYIDNKSGGVYEPKCNLYRPQWLAKAIPLIGELPHTRKVRGSIGVATQETL
jgi:hypothetical protein